MPIAHRRPSRSIAALLAAGLLLLGACSSNGDDDTTTTTTEADGTTTTGSDGGGDDDPTTTSDDDPTTTTETTETTGGSTTTPSNRSDFERDAADSLATSLEIDDDTATCISAAWIDTLGFDRIQDAEVSASDFGNGDETAWGALDVDDDEATALYAALGGCDFDIAAEVRGQLASGQDAATAACVEEVLTDDVVESLMIATFQGSDEANGLVDLLSQCEPESDG